MSRDPGIEAEALRIFENSLDLPQDQRLTLAFRKLANGSRNGLGGLAFSHALEDGRVRIDRFVGLGGPPLQVGGGNVVMPEHRKVGGGEPIILDGVSVFKYEEGKAVYQRDYFDLGAMIYEKVPVLGSVVRWIKKRAHGK